MIVRVKKMEIVEKCYKIENVGWNLKLFEICVASNVFESNESSESKHTTFSSFGARF